MDPHQLDPRRRAVAAKALGALSTKVRLLGRAQPVPLGLAQPKVASAHEAHFFQVSTISGTRTRRAVDARVLVGVIGSTMATKRNQRAARVRSISCRPVPLASRRPGRAPDGGLRAALARVSLPATARSSPSGTPILDWPLPLLLRVDSPDCPLYEVFRAYRVPSEP